MKRIILYTYIIGVALLSACSGGKVLRIAEQGNFAVGGTVLRDSLGRTYHGDHAYVFYQKPVDARWYPLVFAHGVGQFSKTWETTPDGREGFQNIFLRRGFPVYLVDQPRRGNAGRGTERDFRHPLARRSRGLADLAQDGQHQSDSLLRTGRRHPLPRRPGAGVASICDQFAGQLA